MIKRLAILFQILCDTMYNVASSDHKTKIILGKAHTKIILFNKYLVLKKKHSTLNYESIFCLLIKPGVLSELVVLLDQ